MSRGGYRGIGKHHLPVESCHSISARGCFQGAQMWYDGDDAIEWTAGDRFIDVVVTRDGRAHTERIYFTPSHCRYGGSHRWFLCPSCGRRVGKLYLPCTLYIPGTRWRVFVFRCRHCYDLTYLQRQERSGYWTLLHRADRIATHWLGPMTGDFIHKKKWQRWRTFHKRADQYVALIEKSNVAGMGF